MEKTKKKINVKMLVGILIIVLALVAGGVLVKNKIRTEKNHEIWLSQDIVRCENRSFDYETDVNIECAKFNNRYNSHGGYFAVKFESDSGKYKIYPVSSKEEICYANGRATRKYCTESEEECAKRVSKYSKNSCFCIGN